MTTQETQAFVSSRKDPDFAQNQTKRALALAGNAQQMALLLLDEHPDFPPGRKRIKGELPENDPRLPLMEQLFFENATAAADFEALLHFFPEHWRMPIKGWWASRELPDWAHYDRLYGFQANIFTQVLRYDFTLYEYIRYLGFCTEVNVYNFAQDLAKQALLGGDTVLFEQLLGILQGNAESGHVNQMLFNILMAHHDPRGWQGVADLLLAAQRQDGIRQAVCQSLQIAHPKGLAFILQTILDHDLLRFTSIVNYFGQIFQLNWYGGVDEKTARPFFERAIQYLTDSEVLAKNIQHNNMTEAHFALRVLEKLDKKQFKDQLRQMAANGSEQQQEMALAVSHWGVFSVEEQNRMNVEALDSPSLRVRAGALHRIEHDYWRKNAKTLWPKVVHHLNQMPATDPEPIKTGPWWVTSNTPMRLHPFHYMLLMCEPGSTMSPKELLPFLDQMTNEQLPQLLRLLYPKHIDYTDAQQRVGVGMPLPKRPDDVSPSTDERKLVLRLIEDKKPQYAVIGLLFLQFIAPTDAELALLLKSLTRKSGQVRQAAITMLMTLTDERLRPITASLLANKTEEQRTAGLDILQQLKKSDRLADFVQEAATAFAQRPKISTKEEELLKDIRDEAATYHDTEAGLGLFDPAMGIKNPKLEQPTTGYFAEKMYGKPYLGLSTTPEKLAEAIRELDRLIVSKKGFEYEHDNGTNISTVIFGADAYFMPFYYPYNRDRDTSPLSNLRCLPFSEVWEQWFKDSGLHPIDLLLLRTTNGSEMHNPESRATWPDWAGNLVAQYSTNLYDLVYNKLAGHLAYPNYIQSSILPALETYFGQAEVMQATLDWNTHFLASIPPEHRYETFSTMTIGSPMALLDHYNCHFYSFPSLNWDGTVFYEHPPLTDAQFEQLWKIMLSNSWGERQSAFERNTHISLPMVGRAHQLGLITDAGVYQFILECPGLSAYYLSPNPRAISAPNYAAHFPNLTPIFEKMKVRIFEIELKRGDTATPVSNHASHLEYLEGLEYFVRIVKGLGSDVLQRGYTWSNHTKKVVFSKLLKNCHPAEGDTPAAFVERVKGERIPEKRLVEAAIYAPQWLPRVAQLLQWPDLERMAWWLHAHSNDFMDAEKESQTAKYSPVSAQEFKDGAADVAWFQEAFKGIGPERYEILYDAAKYVCDGAGHARARLYADAIQGKLSLAEAQKRVADKRNKDNVVALGLIPLDTKDARADVLARYKLLAGFKKESREFGAQRQASEVLAVRIALDNLARTAGFPDPQRLIWAMETSEAETLMAQAQPLVQGETTVSLDIDSMGKTSLKTIKAGKPLADVPAALKKDPLILALRAVKDALNEQQGRIRKGLEDAMPRGDAFEVRELEELSRHPVIRPLLANLVFIFDQKGGTTLGFYQKQQLADTQGKTTPLKDTDRLRLAHCTDLHTSQQWSAWQKYLFEHRLAQPFKQVFRELYLPTDEERTALDTQRWAGHKVQKSQAAALLKTRGWTVDRYEGMQKVFHAHDLIARLHAVADWFNAGYAETPVLGGLQFVRRRTGEAVALGQVPLLLFSETLRDIDLIVSVANVGGVDIEASLSTIELRRVLVEETARLFGLQNVRLERNHALIKGRLGEYVLHLGSGGVSQMPGGALSVQVSMAQERGRLFLPFVDEDPRTVEILSKLLLFANDQDIKDPGILAQMAR